MTKICCLLAVFVAISVSSVALPVCTPPYTNVIGLDCAAGGMEFSNFAIVSIPPGMQVGIAAFVLGPNGVGIDFAISGFAYVPPANSPDLRIVYKVTSAGALTGVTADIGNATGATTLIESVCDQNGIVGLGGACVDPSIAGMTVFDWNSPTGVAFAPTDAIWVVKDITVPAGYAYSAGLSEFVNTVNTNVPEPAVSGLMGIGLLSLGIIKRWRYNRAKGVLNKHG